MGEQPGERRHRIEDRTSDIACPIDLPPGEPTPRVLLRRFLVVLGELAKRRGA
ncbi:MAG: hypothetical protein K8H90_01645 [Thermoanaerobaculia bacterium]|nr:hypothetical protein [Thermoanaerobaculia bacterium]